MTLIKSISGIRGTIGGSPGQNLTPLDIVECVTGYAVWLKKGNVDQQIKVVVGRDGRISGEMVSGIAVQTLVSMGIDVIDLDLSTTPTVELAVTEFSAHGGIIFTASHNPKEWNALKFLNGKGEFISAEDGNSIIANIEDKNLQYEEVDKLGSIINKPDFFDQHINAILNLSIVDADLIRSKKFHVAVDCINSTGALAIPKLLDALNCSYTLINDTIDGQFAHNPEPLPANLKTLIQLTGESNADLGIAVDPDVDRLALVSEDGSYFGEEYTLVAAADYVLSKKAGNTVSNLSSTRALSDLTKAHGGEYIASAVGEVNVVNAMKANNAVIGGEGNGGVIYPELHYGRDALVGIAFVLNLMASRDEKLSEIRKKYSEYTIIKKKLPLNSREDFGNIKKVLQDKFSNESINLTDGIKIDFAEGWVHVRPSNTEPIVRIYAESSSEEKANELSINVLDQIS